MNNKNKIIILTVLLMLCVSHITSGQPVFSSDILYRIINKQGNGCLTVEGDMQNPGARITLVDQYTIMPANQAWRIEPIGKNLYKIISHASDLSLTVSGDDIENLNGLTQAPFASRKSQHWLIIKQGSAAGVFRIFITQNKTYTLGQKEAETMPRAEVRLEKEYNSESQQWLILPVMTIGQYQKQEELFRNLGDCYTFLRRGQKDKAYYNAMKMVELINKTFAQDHFMNIIQKGMVANFFIQMDEFQPAGEILAQLIKTAETEQITHLPPFFKFFLYNDYAMAILGLQNTGNKNASLTTAHNYLQKSIEQTEQLLVKTRGTFTRGEIERAQLVALANSTVLLATDENYQAAKNIFNKILNIFKEKKKINPNSEIIQAPEIKKTLEYYVSILLNNGQEQEANLVKDKAREYINDFAR